MRVLGAERDMNDRPLALLCWCLLLDRATGFMAPVRSGAASVTSLFKFDNRQLYALCNPSA